MNLKTHSSIAAGPGDAACCCRPGQAAVAAAAACERQHGWQPRWGFHSTCPCATLLLGPTALPSPGSGPCKARLERCAAPTAGAAQPRRQAAGEASPARLAPAAHRLGAVGVGCSLGTLLVQQLSWGGCAGAGARAAAGCERQASGALGQAWRQQRPVCPATAGAALHCVHNHQLQRLRSQFQQPRPMCKPTPAVSMTMPRSK